MNAKQSDIGTRSLAAALLAGTTGLAQAYAVPPTLQADAAGIGMAPAQMGALLWAPLLVLILVLAVGLAWSLWAGRSRKTARRERAQRLTAPSLPVPTAADTPSRRSGRRWRSVAAAAH